jgi:cysteine-rich repeat protein
MLAHARATTDFWTRAEKTLLLSETRSNNTASRPLSLSGKRAQILPLCGNGRVDNKTDYAAYYLNHPPLTISLSGEPRSVTLSADEVCDDGNHLDMDGCSADCMHMDLWVSPCEIATDMPSNVVYESMIWDGGAMVVSTADGLYAMEMGAGDKVVKARLLATKPAAFTVTSIFRQPDMSLILYSASTQTFWRMAAGENRTIDFVRAFTRDVPGDVKSPYLNDDQLKEDFSFGSMRGWDDAGYCNEEDGSIFFHGDGMMAYLETPLAKVTQCLGYYAEKCFFAGNEPGNKRIMHFTCYAFGNAAIYNGASLLGMQSKVTVGPGGLCRSTLGYIEEPPYGSNESRSIFSDVLLLSALKYGLLRTVPYKMDITISPPLDHPPSFAYTQLYHPWGVLQESPTRSAGKVLLNLVEGDMTVGEASIARMLLREEDSCSTSALCAFDSRVGYDLLASDPYFNLTGNLTWYSILEKELFRLASYRGWKRIADIKLKHEGIVYWNFVDFVFNTQFVKPYTSALRVLAFETHPITGNLWALRSDRLVEFSKTGVVTPTSADPSKCLPIGVGLCPKNHWAPSGLPCRPCGETDKSAPAWVARCLPHNLTNDAEELRFTLWGNATAIQAAWPDAVVVANNRHKIIVRSRDPVDEMRRIRGKLRTMLDVQVLTQPHVVVFAGSIPQASPAQNEEEGLSALAKILLIVFLTPVGLLFVCLILRGACQTESKQSYQRLGHIPEIHGDNLSRFEDHYSHLNTNPRHQFYNNSHDDLNFAHHTARYPYSK